MASTGPFSVQCRDRVPFASTFWFNFETSVAIFVISAFAIPGVLVLSNLINSSPNDRSSSAPTCNGPDSNAAIPPHCHPALTPAPHMPGKKKVPVSRILTLVKWMCSTTLLGVASFLLTFQILMALFTGYCLHGLVYTTDLVFVCVIAAIGSVIVAVGFIAWLFTTVALANDFIAWCLDLKRCKIGRVQDSALADVRDTSSPQELPRTGSEVIRHQRVEPPTTTLPPYMV
ncbi:hypothetical protein EPUS_03464 [Endocarpon pusillum Z07020]|uniref:Uncharacterized protein n=1 Tax=Endocarpon pusillum (strain Z07020 / HMAS-L-300199) TaxID=1263415 RepID=U1HM00_ENDPU|nr:uncharacterized protein EPUS_03464 [Endocarpon pusillum Z07020]ERF71310.1 hypothetical protein EPUS_03464 [Endocarpon pusillum Z07020]